MFDEFLTTGEIASYCQVTANTVKNWISDGKLKAFQTPGGHFRISLSEFRNFLERHSMPIDENFFYEKSKKILVVDDNREIVNFIVDALNQMSSNFVIETAFDGYEALMKLGDFKPDLLILDIKMPKIDGFEVCKRIKSSSSLTNTSIFVISAYIDEIGVEKIKDAGADDYLAKPVKLPDLEKKIQKLLKIRVIGTKSGKILI